MCTLLVSCPCLLETPLPRGARLAGAKIKRSPFLVGGDSRSLALAHTDLFSKEMKEHSNSIRKKLTMYSKPSLVE